MVDMPAVDGPGVYGGGNGGGFGREGSAGSGMEDIAELPSTSPTSVRGAGREAAVRSSSMKGRGSFWIELGRCASSWCGGTGSGQGWTSSGREVVTMSSLLTCVTVGGMSSNRTRRFRRMIYIKRRSKRGTKTETSTATISVLFDIPADLEEMLVLALR